jgi:hypothetical protein
MIAAALSFVGLVNAEAVTWNAEPPVALGYLLLAAILAAFGYAARADKPGELDDGLLFVNGTLMRGLPLHDNLAGAELLEQTRTAPVYHRSSCATGRSAARRRRTRRARAHPRHEPRLERGERRSCGS